jgi:hypothetical protein
MYVRAQNTLGKIVDAACYDQQDKQCGQTGGEDVGSDAELIDGSGTALRVMENPFCGIGMRDETTCELSASSRLFPSLFPFPHKLFYESAMKLRLPCPK